MSDSQGDTFITFVTNSYSTTNVDSSSYVTNSYPTYSSSSMYFVSGTMSGPVTGNVFLTGAIMNVTNSYSTFVDSGSYVTNSYPTYTTSSVYFVTGTANVGSGAIVHSTGPTMFVTNSYTNGSDPRALYVLAAATSSLSTGLVLSGGAGVRVLQNASTIAATVDVTVVPTLTGSSTFARPIRFAGGLSGSLTCLADGSPAVLGSQSLVVVTGSAGQLTLSSLPFLPTFYLTGSFVIAQPGCYVVDATAGSFSLSLPDALRCPGMILFVKRVNSGLNSVTCLPSGSQRIDNALNLVLGTLLGASRLVAVAGGWWAC
jgi:hypothetical protein